MVSHQLRLLPVEAPVLGLPMTAPNMELQHAGTECCLETSSLLSGTLLFLFI